MRPTALRSNGKKTLLIAAIVLVAYHLIVFAAAGFEDHGGAFWISYAFTLFAFGVIALSACRLRAADIQPKDWMLGYPVLHHCVVYGVLQLVLSALFMVLEATVDLSWVIPFIVQVLVAAIAGILIVSCFIAHETVQEVNLKVKDSTTFVRLLRVDVEMVVEKAADPAVKQAYLALAEKVRYSDPISNPNLFELEKEIARKVNQAYESLRSEDRDFLLTCCEEASRMLSERNQKCKALK